MKAELPTPPGPEVPTAKVDVGWRVFSSPTFLLSAGIVAVSLVAGFDDPLGGALYMHASAGAAFLFQLVTRVFVHLSLSHLLVNVVFLAIAGLLVEKHLGRVRVLAIWAITLLFSALVFRASESPFHGMGCSDLAFAMIAALGVVAVCERRAAYGVPVVIFIAWLIIAQSSFELELAFLQLELVVAGDDGTPIADNLHLVGTTIGFVGALTRYVPRLRVPAIGLSSATALALLVLPYPWKSETPADISSEQSAACFEGAHPICDAILPIAERHCAIADAAGCRIAGLIHLNALVSNSDPLEAIALLKRGCERGDSNSCALSEKAKLIVGKTDDKSTRRYSKLRPDGDAIRQAVVKNFAPEYPSLDVTCPSVVEIPAGEERQFSCSGVAGGLRFPIRVRYQGAGFAKPRVFVDEGFFTSKSVAKQIERHSGYSGVDCGEQAVHLASLGKHITCELELSEGVSKSFAVKVVSAIDATATLEVTDESKTPVFASFQLGVALPKDAQ